MSDKNNNLILGIALIAGAWYYTRNRPAYAGGMGQIPGRAPLGAGSMPGSVGTGIAQTLGGLLGNLISPKSGGGTSTGAPVTNPDPAYAGDPVINNSVPQADPYGTYEPTLGGPMADDMGTYFA